MTRRFFFALLLLVASVWSVGAQVIVPPIGMATDPDWLTIDALTVNVSIANQIAETETTLKLTNNGERLAEGMYIFPLPMGAAVERLTMTIDGQVIEAKILRADEARAIYDRIVRQYRDPALLEYIGRDLIQANVFPIPPKATREVTIRYGQLLREENGLAHYVFPVDVTKNNGRMVKRMNVRVTLEEGAPLGSIYSPTHTVAITRPADNRAVVSYEGVNVVPKSDFELFYGVQRDDITANLLSYKESAEQDGFFLLMITPPQTVAVERVLPKDVVIVLDQSGSMGGAKWEQAQRATISVLEKLNPQDRFNVVVFSSGWRVFANSLQDTSAASEAVAWVRTLYPEGGTNIHDALKTALGYADDERALTVLFLTDGVATEGIVDTPTLLESLKRNAPANARIFTFGVGDDVDTLLLDSIVRDFRGTGAYVRPSQRVDEAVASLYAKISAPVLNDITLSFDGAQVELLYPRQLPDLFAGEQLVLVGRYRRGAEGVSVTLTGKRDGEQVTLVYPDLRLTERAGGQAFIARLWATRRIGDMLNQIRLNGESKELVDSIVTLSLRYGIITPYTSLLIEEDDILTQQGRERAVQAFDQQAQMLAQDFTGARAVDAASITQDLANASVPQQLLMPTAVIVPLALPTPSMPMGQAPMIGGSSTILPANAQEVVTVFLEPQQRMQTVRGKTFLLQGEIWTDTTYNPDTMTNVTQVVFLSDAYFDLLQRKPELAAYFAVGEQVIVVLDDEVFQVLPAD